MRRGPGGAKWISHFREWKRDHFQAIDRALLASAMVYANAVRRGLQGGFKSGAFAKGTSGQAVQITDAVTEDGVRVRRVGTHLLYNLFWELGHQNTWTRQYERKEVWRPAMEDTADAQAEAFAKVYTRDMMKWEGRK